MTKRAVTTLDRDSARAALDELFTLARKYNSSEAYLELMRFVGQFPFYSPFNAILIHAQMPGAHFVCTALGWRQDYHRGIKIGARPIVILQPMGPILFVFDVSDTAPLPNADPLPIRIADPFQVRSGKIGGQLALTIENAKRDGVLVSERADGSQRAGSIQSAAAGKLGIHRATFYRWYDRYREGGLEALGDHRSRPDRVWNRNPDNVRSLIIDMALEVPELSPRELAVRFTDEKQYFVSEASVYRLLKAHDLITSPAYVSF